MKTIALIEDNPDNRLLVQAILEDEYHILEFETGAEGLEGIKAEVPDLVGGFGEVPERVELGLEIVKIPRSVT